MDQETRAPDVGTCPRPCCYREAEPMLLVSCCNASKGTLIGVEEAWAGSVAGGRRGQREKGKAVVMSVVGVQEGGDWSDGAESPREGFVGTEIE